jgi:hypothetical protein
MRTRGLAISFLGVAVVLGVADPAAAEGRPPSSGGGAYIDPDGDPTAVSGDGGASPGGGGSGGDDGCTWEVAIEDDFEFYVYDDFGEYDAPVHSATGRWLYHICDGTIMDMLPEGGLVDPRAVATQALASVGIAGPVVGTSPAADRLVVRIPSWFWIDGGWWHTYSATASTGRVSSTVTVRPVSAAWSTGDGGGVTCAGPGVPWTPGAPEDATDCSYTYTVPSSTASGAYSLTATVTFEVTWASNTGQGGSLGSISRSTTQPVVVGEVQAVGTR